MSIHLQTFDDVEREIDALKHEVVGLEHRLVQVVRNAYWALTKKEGWPTVRRLEAGAALIRYFLSGRTAIVVGVSLGGLLALHASFMLADQNRKLDLQNHLAVVSSEIAEAQRNSQFAQLIPSLVEDANRTKSDKKSALIPSGPQGDGRKVTALSEELALRVAVLTQTFQPYRWVERTTEGPQLLAPTGDGVAFRTMQGIRRAYEKSFGSSPLDARQGPLALQLPILTQDRHSPERGLILLNLYALRMDLRTLTRFNVTFEKAYMPGARLDGIDLGGLVGPELSKPVSLRGAFMPHVTLNRASLGSVNFTEADLRGAEFHAADARSTNWTSAKLEKADFQSADLARATFDRATLQGADLRYANLKEADLLGAIGLTSSQLRLACIDPNTTRIHSSALPSDYAIPDQCCNERSGWSNAFAKSRGGACVATD